MHFGLVLLQEADCHLNNTRELRKCLSYKMLEKEKCRFMMISFDKKQLCHLRIVLSMWDVDEPSTRMCLQAVLKGADVAAHLSPVVGVFGDPSHLDRLCGAAKNRRR